MEHAGLPFASNESVVSAIGRLAAITGISDVDPQSEDVRDVLRELRNRFIPSNNENVKMIAPAEAAHAREISAYPARDRILRKPVHLTAAPGCCPASAIYAVSPDFTLLSLKNGFFCVFAHAPIILDSSAVNMIEHYSSRYAGLIYYYSEAMPQIINNASYIDGTVLVIHDDIGAIQYRNYCHWLVDQLTRLSFLGFEARRQDCFIVTAPADTPWQMETLKQCGFDNDRVLTLGRFDAIQARELLVPSDLSRIPHPAHKGAPWALHYLRSAVGYGSAAPADRERQKLYVSRNDASARRVLNEDELLAALHRYGYQSVQLSALPVAEQVSLFSSASHIVGLHGAGLSNIVFANSGCALLEIFAHTYGTPAYYVLTAAQGLPYYSYVEQDVRPGERHQFDDITIDVNRFLAVAREIL